MVELEYWGGHAEDQVPRYSHLLESLKFPCILYEKISKIKLKNDRILMKKYCV